MWRPAKTPLQREIRRLYLAGLPLAEIAQEVGSTRGSVQVMASRLGLKRDPGHRMERVKATQDKRRGFAVPTDKMKDYQRHRNQGFTKEEAGFLVGVRPRPKGF